GYWSLQLGGQVLRTARPVVPGEAALLVVRLDFTAEGGTASLFVNPPALGGAPPAAADAQGSSANLSFSSVAYYGGDGPGASAVDERRLGPSSAAVTPTRQPPATR